MRWLFCRCFCAPELDFDVDVRAGTRVPARIIGGVLLFKTLLPHTLARLFGAWLVRSLHARGDGGGIDAQLFLHERPIGDRGAERRAIAMADVRRAGRGDGLNSHAHMRIVPHCG